MTVSRVRPVWPDLPAFVRKAIEAEAGGPVVSWMSHDGGFTPGWALSLTTPGGEVFVKVASTEHPDTVGAHRREAVKAAALPDGVPAPRLRWSLEVPDPEAERMWVVVASDVVHGRAPRTEPWDLDELDLLGRLAHRIGEHAVPVDGPFPAFAAGPWPHAGLLADERPAGLAGFDPWFAANLDRLAELASPQRQAEAFAGDGLVHNDLRADNALIVRSGDGEEAVAVDWPHAKRGAAFLDQAGMLPAVAATGGPTPSETLARIPFPPGTDDDAVNVWVATLACYFAWSALQDPPPGIPHVRAFQRAQAGTALAWLRERVGT